MMIEVPHPPKHLVYRPICFTRIHFFGQCSAVRVRVGRYSLLGQNPMQHTVTYQYMTSSACGSSEISPLDTMNPCPIITFHGSDIRTSLEGGFFLIGLLVSDVVAPYNCRLTFV